MTVPLPTAGNFCQSALLASWQLTNHTHHTPYVSPYQ
jgi:hypothetical protein